jgi:transcriptional regulator with XRE-family HTH domain
LILLRRLLGDALRRQRLRQARTLRDVSADARVSLGYLSEVERGQKEASSELLSSICDALGVQLSTVLREVSDELRTLEIAGTARDARAFVPRSHVLRAEAAAEATVREAVRVAEQSSATAAVHTHDHEVVAAA